MTIKDVKTLSISPIIQLKIALYGICTQPVEAVPWPWHTFQFLCKKKKNTQGKLNLPLQVFSSLRECCYYLIQQRTEVEFIVQPLYRNQTMVACKVVGKQSDTLPRFFISELLGVRFQNIGLEYGRTRAPSHFLSVENLIKLICSFSAECDGKTRS